MTNKQKKELIVWEYFIPKGNWQEKTDKDIKMFFEWSEQGKHKELAGKYGDLSYFNALVWGKKYAGINTHELWEQGILEGTVPYWTLLGGEEGDEPMPRQVVDYVKKEIFKGVDADIIEEAYQKVLSVV